MLPGIIPMWPSSGTPSVPFSVSYLSHDNYGSGSTATYTVSQAIPSSTATQLLIVRGEFGSSSAPSNDGTDITSIKWGTIAGTSVVHNYGNGASGYRYNELFIIVIPAAQSGQTLSLVMTMKATNTTPSMSRYLITGPKSLTADASGSARNTATMSLSLAGVAGGAAILFTVGAANTAGDTYTGVTKNFEVVQSNLARCSGGSNTSISAGTNTYSVATGLTSNCLVGATFH